MDREAMRKTADLIGAELDSIDEKEFKRQIDEYEDGDEWLYKLLSALFEGE